MIVIYSRVFRAVIVMALLLSSCSGPTQSRFPEITEARIGQPTGPNAALYFTAGGYGSSDRLLSVSTRIAPEAALHETVLGNGGAVSMQPIAGLELPANEDLVLEPGGFHVMLVDVDRLDVGAVVAVELVWEQAGAQEVDASVVAPSDTMGFDMDETGSG